MKKKGIILVIASVFIIFIGAYMEYQYLGLMGLFILCIGINLIKSIKYEQ